MNRVIFSMAALLCCLSSSAQTFGMASIFRSWGFVGDSLCSGEMECFAEGDDAVKYIDMYEYSWGQQLCRLCGSEGYNFSHGGQTARGWIDEEEGQRGWGWAKTHPKQAYIIALGVNDYTHGMAGAPGFSLEDFAAAMAGIISRLKSVSPDAFFFVLTRPQEDAGNNDYDRWNDVIRALPDRFSRLWVIDMYRDAPVYDADFKEQYYLNGHLSPAGYLYTAHFLSGAIDRIVREHPADFREVALSGTPWRGHVW